MSNTISSSKVKHASKNDDRVSEAELVVLIHAVVKKQEVSGIGFINLGHWDFDRIPCSARRLYAIARKHCGTWGYEYRPSDYKPSGNRAFQRNHKRGQYSHPGLYKIGR